MDIVAFDDYTTEANSLACLDAVDLSPRPRDVPHCTCLQSRRPQRTPWFVDFYAVLDFCYVIQDSYSDYRWCPMTAGEERQAVAAAVWRHPAASRLLGPDLRRQHRARAGAACQRSHALMM